MPELRAAVQSPVPNPDLSRAGATSGCPLSPLLLPAAGEGNAQQTLLTSKWDLG